MDSLLSEEIIKALSSSGITAILALAAGVAASFWASKLSKERREDQQRIRELSKLPKDLFDTLEQQRLSLISEVATKVPRGASAEELKSAVSSAVGEGIARIEEFTKKQVDVFGELVRGYHTQALGQARVQFWFSVIAASVGFLYIISATVYGLASSSGFAAAALNALPGVVMEAVAALFFRQAEQTRERATALYDRLRQDNQINAARVIVDSIDDLHIKSLVRAQIALHVSGLKPKEIDLQAPK